MEGVSVRAIENCVHYYHNPEKRSRPMGSRQVPEKLVKSSVEGLVSSFLEVTQDFATQVLRKTQEGLLRDLARKEAEIVKLKDQLKVSYGVISELRAAAKSADAGRTKEILKRAGVTYGD